MKLALVCIIAFAAFAAAAEGDQKKVESRIEGGSRSASTEGQLKKRMAAVGVKDLDLKKLSGKWFNIASSAAIHQQFIKSCTCNELHFKPIANNKLHAMALCRNVENQKIIAVNGTLTQVKPQENKALFHLEFTEKKGDIKGVKVNQTEATEVKKQLDTGKTDVKKEAGQKVNATAADKAKDLNVNTVILKADDKFEHVLMGSPSLDAAWILSRDRKFDEKLFNSYKSFLEENGFATTKLVRIDHGKCQSDLMKDLNKGKSVERESKPIATESK